jgi:tRNA-dihydrouridine synthase
MAAKIVEVTQPDLLDINFGCPVKKVALKGAGAGVLKDLDLMVRLTSFRCKINFPTCHC